MDLKNNRNEYLRDQLNEARLSNDPFELFRNWMQLAMQSNIYDANAMVLSTCVYNRPSARVVLLKTLDKSGFVFFTNYQSRKGKELEANPFASLTFYWNELEKQVRVEGKVERTSDSESDVYFNSRPKESRVSAVVSNQSKEIPSREILEEEQKLLLNSPRRILRPDHWGGYRLIPDVIEYWQGRENRLNDRIQYFKKNGVWTYRRLAP